MPTYEYACRSCRRHTEAVQSFSDPPLTECPHCGGELKRVFHPVGILLKGSGFYSTDNRSSKRPLATKDSGGDAGSSTDSAASTSSDSPAETKPAKDAAPKKSETKPAAKPKKSESGTGS